MLKLLQVNNCSGVYFSQMKCMLPCHRGLEMNANYQPLRSTVASEQAPPATAPGHWLGRRLAITKSKGALMILVWNIVVGATYAGVLRGASAATFLSQSNDPNFHPILYGVLGLYSFVAAVQFLFYPLGGLIADIYCGRYRVIALSAIKICCGYGVLLVPVILLASEHYSVQRSTADAHPAIYASQGATTVVSLILFVLGFTGFQANAVQFGLDQLQDAPSDHLSTFLHWFVWTDALGQMTMGILIMLLPCYDDIILKIVVNIPFVLFPMLTATLVLSYCRRKWFHSEPRAHNPYGMVYRVLKFVARHNKPLQRSAFTHCDDEIPSRMEFAKQRFGGPFPTETVEDVKTFLRILVMLLAIGPVYIVHVAVTYLFPLYGVHVGPIHSLPPTKHGSCHYLDWIVLESGNLTYLVSVLFLLLYILCILPIIRKYYLKILFRLGVGMVLLLLAAVAMTVTQVIAHYLIANSTNISCLFDTKYYVNSDFSTLDLPSWVLIFPNLLSGIAVPLIYVTILEFISAQSPHTMKGLLLGTFYAVRGLFTILGCSLVFPFANDLWINQQGALFDCGVSYYVSTVLLGVVGLALFGLAARWYQYRERDDVPYGPRYVEDYYQHYIRPPVAVEDSPQDGEGGILGNSNYGTMVDT